MKKYGFLILFTILLSCKSTLEKIKTSNNLEESIENITNHINSCYEGSNQIDVDEKAEFDVISKVLTIYIGKSSDDYLKKWEIPLSKINPDKVLFIKDEFGMMNELRIFTFQDKKEIRYYKNQKLNSLTNKNTFYLFDYCSKTKNSDEIFFESIKRAIILSQK